jgi:hypothetical protein
MKKKNIKCLLVLLISIVIINDNKLSTLDPIAMLKNIIFYIILFLPLSAFTQNYNGFFNFKFVDSTAQLILEVPEEKINYSFLYVNSLAAGIGSNDIGLDRGQLGDTRVVSFYRSGNKLLLLEKNMKYRAVSDNALEQKAVEEAFAQSVIWGFKIMENSGGNYYIDLSAFLLRDAHGIARTLANKQQGAYKLDKEKSAIYIEQLANFPKNTEFEALLTFTGEPKGAYIRSVSPSSDLVSVRQHHSFIELPDDNYQPRTFYPASGYSPHTYYDYATSIDAPLQKKFIKRHRLEKKNPEAILSEAVEPIIYYIDPGCPEPIKSALIEGASWWDQAFEAAGYKDAFQVKELPEGASPLDIRYNMIQWVHRSTRGWSYGASVADPRTGEIIKGHVSLGSLRVRQDYMIAQGILSSYNEESDDPRMLELSLARLRQLSAHEVGHTIGLAHNFASSVNDRASVMDYPHPYIIAEKDKSINMENAYGISIGAWDKRSIIFGYSSIPRGSSEKAYLESILAENEEKEFLYITDQDARPVGGAHPYAHLWDNGTDPIEELSRISMLRKDVLSRMGTNSIPDGTPYSEIEKLIVPAYLMHRYQVEAVAKMIGGIDYAYTIKNKNNNVNNKKVDIQQQEKALTELLSTLDHDFLQFPDNLVKVITPSAFGYPRDRETFKGHTGVAFDPLAAAESSANHTLTYLLHPQRLTRIYLQEEGKWTLDNYLGEIQEHINGIKEDDINTGMMLDKLLFIHLMKLSENKNTNKQVNALALFHYNAMTRYQSKKDYKKELAAHNQYLIKMSTNFLNDPASFVLPSIPDLPPGSPIGCH